MGVLAVVAPFDHTAQRGCTAILDGLHQTVLMHRQRVRLPVSRAVFSKDIGQLQGWLHIHAGGFNPSPLPPAQLSLKKLISFYRWILVQFKSGFPA